jgi:hypothetical protein
MKLPRGCLITFFSHFAAVQYISEFNTFMVQLTEEEERAQLLFIFIQKERVKSWRISLKLIAVDDTVKTSVLGLRIIFSYDIQRYVPHDQAYDMLSANKDR